MTSSAVTAVCSPDCMFFSCNKPVCISSEPTNNTKGISVYIHLPYCESLCTYCGCNTRITVNHKVEEPYIDGILKEWEIYLNNFGEEPLITELHLGGGTPTFFSPENLAKLILGLKSKAKFRMVTKKIRY